jgi:photosystem II stability/assembly factor-like uncharacterized protein
MKRYLAGWFSIVSIVLIFGVPAAAAAPFHASQRFDWLLPAPQGNVLTAVDFVSSGVGWAVGANGTVLKTTNAGISWTQQGPIAPQGPADVVYDMTDVCFVNGQSGWASGGNRVWRTVNGGALWTDVTPEYYDPASFAAMSWQSVDFTDAHNGWVVGRDRIYHTTDGGAHWTRQRASGDFLYDVSTGSAQTAFACGTGSGYLKTDDAGSTWTQYTLTGTGYESSAVSMLAVSDGLDAYAVAAGRLFRTTNGGTSWTSMPVGNTAGDDVVAVGTMDGSGGTVAWAFTNSGRVFKTMTGGATTWAAGPTLASATYAAPSAPTADSVFTITGSAVWASADGGGSFSARRDAWPSAPFSSVQFTGPATGYAVGGSTLARTTNGGGAWSATSLAAYGLFATDVFFLPGDPRIGWIVGSPSAGGPSVLKTTDGGASWQPQAETAMVAREVCFADAQHGWATTNTWGFFWHSIDGGASWTKVVRAGFFWDMDFVDATHGWIALDPADGSNAVLHTADGGETWVAQTLPASGGHIYQLDFVDVNTGWCSDSFANIYKTTNGGATWSKLPGGPSSTVDILDMKFVSRSEGWIAGEQWTSAILSSYRHDFAAHTSDGGKTWDFELNPAATANGSTGSKIGLRSIDTVSGDVCFVVGGNGSILRGYAVPVLTRLGSPAARRGATVTITGGGFGATRGASYVKFGATKCTRYLSWSKTRIVCKVPSKAKFGSLKIRVTTGAGTSNTRTFKVRR